MTELDNFIWQGEKGEPLRFADLPASEQRVALIAAGALLRGGSKREDESSDAVTSASLSAGRGDLQDLRAPQLASAEMD